MIIVIADESDALKHAIMEHIKDSITEKDQLESELIKLKHSLNLSLAIFYDFFGKEYGAIGGKNKESGALLFPSTKEHACNKAIRKKLDSYAVLNIRLEAIDTTIKELEDRYRKNYNRSFFKYRV